MIPEGPDAWRARAGTLAGARCHFEKGGLRPLGEPLGRHRPKLQGHAEKSLRTTSVSSGAKKILFVDDPIFLTLLRDRSLIVD
jgi:hypothetical protein